MLVRARRLASIYAAALLVGCAAPAARAPESAAPAPVERPRAIAGGVTAAAPAPSPRPATFTLEQVVAEALARRPAMRAAQADERAARARADVADLATLPSAGVTAQLNRSTSNTIPGAFFPTANFPSIAGPVEKKALDGGVWQTGVGLWASWDVLGFAREAGAVDAALAQRHAASARVSATQLDVAYGAADAFLLLFEAQESLRAAQASLDRAATLVRMTEPLVAESLRPGVDLARAQAELSRARTTVASAAQARRVRQADLATAIGQPELVIDADRGRLLEPIDAAPVRTAPLTDHPRIVEANAAVENATASVRVVDARFLPRVDLVAALFARGTGVTGTTLPRSPADGLVPDVANWAAGIAVTWNALDVPAIRDRARAASADQAAAIARRDETVLAVTGQLERASAYLEGARAIARETPIGLAAAQAAAEQALARYRASLATMVEVADAERVLAQADIDDAIARIEVRRALLALGRASGDLGPAVAGALSGAARAAAKPPGPTGPARGGGVGGEAPDVD